MAKLIKCKVKVNYNFLVHNYCPGRRCKNVCASDWVLNKTGLGLFPGNRQEPTLKNGNPTCFDRNSRLMTKKVPRLSDLLEGLS